MEENIEAAIKHHNEFMVRYNDHFTLVPSSLGFSTDTNNMWSTNAESNSTGYSESPGGPSSILFLPPPDDKQFLEDLQSGMCRSCCKCEEDSGRYSSACCSEYIFNGGQHLGSGSECYTADGSHIFFPEDWGLIGEEAEQCQ